MLNQIIHGDCFDVLKDIPDDYFDMTLTSPPYDNLRTYNGSLEWGEHIWKPIIQELYRVTMLGGVVVWIVGDATIKGSETGTSFKQALWAKECGFNLHDTMIYKKISAFPSNVRYSQDFEYMFIFSKGSPKTLNFLRQMKTEATLKRQKNKAGVFGERQKNGGIRKFGTSTNAFLRKEKARQDKTRVRSNVWDIANGYNRNTKDKIALKHPAIFPEQLAKDHILSWSNPGDLVLDPFCGSGTTAVTCKELGRNYICIEKEKEYFDIACDRVSQPREYSEIELETRELKQPEFKQLSLFDIA